MQSEEQVKKRLDYYIEKATILDFSKNEKEADDLMARIETLQWVLREGEQ